MSNWSNLSHHFSSAAADFNDPDFRPGIDLTLNQLLETRVKPVINWLAADSMVKTQRVGGFRSRFKGRGMDFDEVRMYQIGDDIRNIDWKVTARTGHAHTKLFKEEREKPVFVVLDQMPSMFFGTAQVFKSLLACQIAGQLMWNSLNNGDRFGALLFSENNHFEMKPSGNRRHCMRLLNRIVENHQQTLENYFSSEKKQSTAEQITQQQNNFSETLRRLQYLAKPGSVIHIISDFNQFDSRCEKQLSKLSQHADLHCVFVNDTIESQLPPAGIYGISNGVENSILDTSKENIRLNYALAFENKLDKLKSFTISHRGIFTSINTQYEQNRSSKINQSINSTEVNL